MKDCREFSQFALLPLLGALCLLGQMNTGEIAGSVQDALGGALPGATVVAEQAQTGQKFTTTTNSSGQYLLTQLPIGTYSLKVNATNFKQSVISNVEVHVGDSLRHDVTVQIGDASETVVVEADSGAVQPESAEIKDVVQSRQIVNLPLKTREFLDLAMLSQGVVRPPGGTRGDAMQQAGTLVNVLGQRSGHNLYLMDGATVTDEHFNNMVIAPSIDAIERIQHREDFLRARVRRQVRSGDQRGHQIRDRTSLHGSLFEFVRNDVFDAKNFFDSQTAPIPPFRQNQFGGSVGGPIRSRIEHSFSPTTKASESANRSRSTFSVPTAAMRTGDFTGLARRSIDPASGRQPFLGNQFPQRPFRSRAVGPAGEHPVCRTCRESPRICSRPATSASTATNASAKLDHQFSAQDTAFLRDFALRCARSSIPFGSGVLQESLLPGFGRNLSTHTLNGVAGWTHVFSPNS